MKKIVIAIIVCAALFLISCERTSRQLGGKAASSASSYESTVVASISAVPREAHLELTASQTGGKALDGAQLYMTNCVACHQPTGQGIPGAFPPLDGSEYVVGDNVEQMAAIMIYGLNGPITVKGGQFNNVMAPLGRLQNEELAAIATYIRSAWSNKAAAVDAAVFQAARDKYGSRAMLTVAELN